MHRRDECRHAPPVAAGAGPAREFSVLILTIPRVAISGTSLSLKVSGLPQGSDSEGAGNDVRNVRLFRALLGVDQRTVIEDTEFEEPGGVRGRR